MKLLKDYTVSERKVVLPSLPIQEWEGTYKTIQLWSEIIGKIKLEFCPFVNHWWNITFYPTASGLTTGVIPYVDRFFQIDFDFITHQLVIKTDSGNSAVIRLSSGTIADFYAEVKEKLNSLDIGIHIWTVPVEIEDRTPFDKDNRVRNYDPEYAHRYWKALLEVHNIMAIFRSGFTGKASPVHFFWGSVDLAVTFFSGRPAPEHPGVPTVGREVMVEAYNAELASFGFWGGVGTDDAAFYAYAYPEPNGYHAYTIMPQEAYYNERFGEFILPYESVRTSPNPIDKVLSFYRSAFAAAEDLANWDRSLYKGII